MHPIGHIGILDADRPHPLAGWRPQQILIAACVDEPAESPAPEHVGSNFDREAFRDAAQIELDARTGEADGVMLGIEDQIAIVDERPHRRELGGGRDVRRLVVEAPQPHERPDRDVERAV